MVRTPDQMRERGIDVRVRHEAREIDPGGGRVRVRNRETGAEVWEGYDHLLISTGAEAVRPDLPGLDAPEVLGVTGLESGLAVEAALERLRPREAVIVGGGYIGLEMAEALVRRGLAVSLVERAPQVMGTLDPDMGALVSQAVREVGVTLYLEEALEAVDTDGGSVRAVVTERRTLPAQLVILGLGVRPETRLAREANVPLGARGSVRVNRRMQTEVDRVWAAGDCAESFHRVSRKPVHVALGTVANKHGRVAGMNLGGRYATFPGVVGTAVSKICAVEVARTGLMESEIRELGWEFETARIESRTRAHYYPDAGKITVKLLAERGSGRLLGAQIVGVEGAAKRIDVVAAALTAEMRVRDLVDMDLSYAPPYSPVWDPVQTAARVLGSDL